MTKKNTNETFDSLLEKINHIEVVSDKNINKILTYFDSYKKADKTSLAKADVIPFFEASLKKIEKNEMFFFLKFYNSVKTLRSKSDFKDEALTFIHNYCNNIIFLGNSSENDKQQIASNDYKLIYLFIGECDKAIRQNNAKAFDQDDLSWFCITTIYLWFVCKYKNPDLVLIFEKALIQYFAEIEDEKVAQQSVMRVVPEALEIKSEWKRQLRKSLYLFWDTAKVLQKKEDFISTIYSNIDRLRSEKKDLSDKYSILMDEKEKLEDKLKQVNQQYESAVREKDAAIAEQIKSEETKNLIAHSSDESFNAMKDNLFSNLRISLKHEIEGIETTVSQLDEKNANRIKKRLLNIENIINDKIKE